MWIPIVLIGGAVVYYFFSQAKPAPVAPPRPGIPGLPPGIIPAGLFAPAAPVRQAAPAPVAAAAPAALKDGGPYFQAYEGNMNDAAASYNAGTITFDNWDALEQGYWANAQADYASGNMTANDLAQLKTLMTVWGRI